MDHIQQTRRTIRFPFMAREGHMGFLRRPSLSVTENIPRSEKKGFLGNVFSIGAAPCSLYHLKNTLYSVFFKRGGKRQENLAKKVLGSYSSTREFHAAHSQPACQGQGLRNGWWDQVGCGSGGGSPALCGSLQHLRHI